MEYKRQTSTSSPSLPNLLPSANQPNRTLDKAFFRNLVPDFMSHIYPMYPVVAEAEVRRSIEEMESSDEALSFVHALAAYTMALAFVEMKGSADCSATIHLLVEESIRRRRRVVGGFASSVRTCMTALLLHLHFSSMRDAQASFFYLREAATLLQMLGIDDSVQTAAPSQSEQAQRQRLHWVVFTAERTWAILNEQSPVLFPPSALPEDDGSVPDWIHQGMYDKARLMQVVDAGFLQTWLLRSEGSFVSADWVRSKYRLLGQPSGDKLSIEGGKRIIFSGEQQAELLITKFWIQVLIWRTALYSNLLSLDSPEDCLSLLHPMRLCGELRMFFDFVSPRDIRSHGLILLRMLFEVIDTITDVMMAAFSNGVHNARHYVDDFRFVTDQFFQLPSLDNPCEVILRDKLAKLEVMIMQADSGTEDTSTSISELDVDGMYGSPYM